MTILVCDDDKEIVDAIEIYLQQEGFDVEKAYDGEQALEIMKTKSIDLLVIDVMMPKIMPLYRYVNRVVFQLLYYLRRQRIRTRY